MDDTDFPHLPQMSPTPAISQSQVSLPRPSPFAFPPGISDLAMGLHRDQPPAKTHCQGQFAWIPYALFDTQWGDYMIGTFTHIHTHAKTNIQK